MLFLQVKWGDKGATDAGALLAAAEVSYKPSVRVAEKK